MKKLLSKVLALTLCMCVMVGMSTAASAAGFERGVMTEYSHLKANSFSGLSLNVYGNEIISNFRNVNVYSTLNVASQRWKVIMDSSYNKYLASELRDAYGNQYSLDMFTGSNPSYGEYGNADVYINDYKNPDARILFETIYEGNKVAYYINSARYSNRYLNAESNNNCTFSTSNRTKWYETFTV